ncbi:hypothetical protein KI688_006534 [Linnemannia hyalina]|uniref:HCP-like protein n=1 Tax=Linnemannia hyalina TaxID=64524 RepID=A0A9P8BQS2_9FUNG|nr:hypothetical protein KI688_006534 [Linnemannia hyalina]
MPPQDAVQGHVQGFRSVHESQPPSTTTVPLNSPKVVHIDCYTDPDTNRDFILWEDIQQAFSEALSVRNRTKVLPFAKGKDLRALEPRQITAVPDVVLDVVVGPAEYNHMDVPASVSHRRGPQTVHDEHKDDSSNAPAEKGHQPKAVTKNLLDPQDYDAAADMSLMQTMIKANSGDVQAQVALGDRYNDGREVYQNCDAALDWYLKAAEQHHPRALFNIGLLYDQGHNGVPQDNAKAFEWFLKAALQGYADAQVKVSQAYTDGAGVPQDNIEAMEWSVKAAENGHEGMQYNMGAAYEKGQGVPQSDSRSFEWYLKSADQGFTKAQERVGAALEAGRGVSRDGLMAVEWYTKAADQGLPVAQFALGRVHKLGLCGLPKNLSKAVDWLIKAAVQGHTRAQSMLNGIYNNRMTCVPGVTLDLEPYSKIREWFMNAADQGVAHAQVCMGDMYRKGFSLRRDESKAFQWYLKAAEQGHEAAQGIAHHK